MSLFPAYKIDEPISQINDGDHEKWLANSSFPSLPVLNLTSKNAGHKSEESADDSAKSKEKRRKKKKKKRKRERSMERLRCVEESTSIAVPEESDERFSVDNSFDYLLQKAMETPSNNRPIYSKPRLSLLSISDLIRLKKRNKKKKDIRYFSGRKKETGQDDEIVDKELSHQVEELNKAVREDPHDVSAWLQLVDFQDIYFKYNPIRYKSKIETERAANLQKLSILERAMSSNVANEQLQQVWSKIAYEHYTFAEIDSVIKELTKHRFSFGLSLMRVSFLQRSTSNVTSNAVCEEYKNMYSVLREYSWKFPRRQMDSFVFELLFHASIFLQQAGRWEYAWQQFMNILRLSFDLRIPFSDSSDDSVLQHEDNLLQESSDVPLWMLWLKMESLRQGFHFWPVAKSENFPMRVVDMSMDDLLIHHFSSASSFQLLLLVPLLANVPLLPRSHSLFNALSSQCSPILLDGIEAQLGALFLTSPTLEIDLQFVTNHMPISLPPQYLRNLPGQKEFFNLVTTLFSTILANAEGRQRVALGIWYLRFLRWLDSLKSYGVFQTFDGQPATKSLFKDFMKEDLNREVIPFYIEFALWQLDQGDDAAAKCIKTLETLAASHKSPLSETNENLQSDLCRLYRTMCEVHIRVNNVEGAKACLKYLGGSATDSAAIEKLKTVAMEMISNSTEERIEDMMLPNFKIDAIACYVWYLALVDRMNDAVGFLTNAIPQTDSYFRESLYELLIIVVRRFSVIKHAVDPYVREAIKLYPVNATFSLVMAEGIATTRGAWRLSFAHLLHWPVTAGAVLLACASLERQKRNGALDAISVLKSLASGAGKRSSIIHRILLKSLKETNNLLLMDTVSVFAVDSCPCNKNLYLDVISTLPAQFKRLSDILKEKRLGLHVYPSEVAALRD